jgi:hypothetical protein
VRSWRCPSANGFRFEGPQTALDGRGAVIEAPADFQIAGRPPTGAAPLPERAFVYAKLCGGYRLGDVIAKERAALLALALLSLTDGHLENSRNDFVTGEIGAEASEVA